MSDQHALTEEQKTKVLNWFRSKNGPRPCSVCGDNNWTLGAHLVVPNTWAGGAISMGGMSYPQVMLICRNCGHTNFFNAVIVGALENSKPKETPSNG